MSEAKMSMKADGKIAPTLALAGWLFLFVLPLLALYYSFFAYADFIFQRKISAKKQFLYNELFAFIDDLSLQKSLQRKFSKFNQNFDFCDAGALEIRHAFEKKFQVKVAAVISHELASGHIETSLNDKIDMEFSAPPGIFLKRFFAFQKNQEKAAINSKSAEKSLFRSFFGNICEIDLPSGQIKKSISTRFGDTGPVYYCFFSDPLHQVEYLAVVREQDISPAMVINDAIAKSRGDFKRTFSRSKRKLKFPDDINPVLFSEFVESKDGIAITTILPATNFIHLVQRGTIVPKNLRENFDNVPLIGVSFSPKKFSGELTRFKNIFKFACVLFFLLGSTLFIRIALFGINFHLSVSTKVFAALALAGFFPVAIFVFAYSAFSEYGQINQIQLGQQMLQQKIAAIRKQIHSGVNQIEVANIELAAKIERAPSDQARIDMLKQIIEDDFTPMAYFQKISGERTVLVSEKLPENERWQKYEMNAFEIFVHQLIDLLRTSPHLNIQAGSMGRILTDILSNRTSFNNVLRASGKLQNIEKLTRKFWFACVLIFNYDSGRAPDSVLFPGFIKTRVIQQQLQQVVKNFRLSERQADFQIDLALALGQNKEIVLSPDFVSPALNPGEVKSKLRLAEMLKRELVWETRDADGVEIAVYDEALPYLCFGRITRIAKADYTGEYTGVIFYLLLLALLVLMVAELFFVAPVKKIAAGLLKVGNGKFDHHFAPKTGDEFDQLGSSLNSMLRGLIEKEILSEYVSDDVKQAVSLADGSDLAPGGEMVEAAVLFCEPLKFSDFAAESDPEEVVRYLNNFIAIADQLCCKNGGAIDKIIENTLMMVFREKSSLVSHAMAAAQTAIELNHRLGPQNREFPFSCKIGIACGPVISGKIGSSIGKLDFTVIGDTVNLAARLKSIAEKAQQSRILLSQQTVEQLGLLAETRCVELVEIKGKTGKYEVFELLQVKSLTKDVI